jgi:hypothetical protein
MKSIDIKTLKKDLLDIYTKSAVIQDNNSLKVYSGEKDYIEFKFNDLGSKLKLINVFIDDKCIL